MALKKTIINEKGVSTDYHKIANITIAKEKDRYILYVEISSYTNQDYREQNENNFAEKRSTALDSAKEEIEIEPIYSLVYRKLKETPDFEGAEDC